MSSVRAAGARPLRRAVLALVLVLLAAVVWLAVRGVQVARALQAAAPEAAAVQQALGEGDVDAASGHLPALQEHSGAALAGTRDPVWRAASHLPWVGAQLTAVGRMAEALDLTAVDVVPLLADAASVVRPAALVPVDGSVPLAPLIEVRPAVAGAADAAARAHALVEGIETAGLLGPIADAVADARGPLGEAARLLARADEAVTLLPPLLGADGPRSYLVLVVNPAELRSGGGIVGSVVVLHADGGRVTLGEQVASRTLPVADPASSPLSADELEVHGDRLGSLMQNVTMTPDFPRAAELAVGLWEAAGREAVDGVLAVEPGALAGLLGVAGPVTTTDGTVLDGDGAVQALLLDAYARYPDPDETDAFFADAAARVFDAMLRSPGSPTELAEAFGRAVGERRVAFWSAHPAEQSVLAGTALGGSFFDPAAGASAGVFLDDGTGTKLTYFLDVDVQVSCIEPAGVPGPTGAAGAARALLVVDLASGVPADLSTLPPYMATAQPDEPPTGITRTNVTLYAPVGGRLVDVRSGDAAVGTRRAGEAGRDAAVFTAVLAPGESVRYEVVVELADGVGELGAWRTPTVTGAGTVPAVSCTA